MRGIVTAFVLAYAWIAPHEAGACSLGPCWRPTQGFDAGGTVPANAPGIGFHVAFGGAAIDSGVPVELLFDGGAVPSAVTFDDRNEVTIMPDAALAPGAYAIRGPGCAPGLVVPEILPLVVVGAAPLPTKLGALRVVASGSRSETGTCPLPTTPIVSFVDVALALAPEAEPYAGNMRFVATIDGAPLGPGSAYGSFEVAARTGYLPDPPITHIAFACEPRPVIPLGRHRVGLRAHIAGAGDLDAEIDADFFCNPRDAGAGEGGPPDASASDPGGRVGGGCSCGHGADAPSGLLGVIVAGLLWRRRRGRGSARP